MFQLAIPVNLRAIARLASALPAALVGLTVMYLAFGVLGAAVLLVVLLPLGRLLLKAARGR